MSFQGKVVLITGASSGIGASTAFEFAKNGASVAIVGRNVEKLNKAAENCSKYSKPLVIQADIGEDDECKKIVASVVKTFGKLDVLVNNAGIMRHGTILEGNLLEIYDEIMKVNMRGHLNVTSLAVPYLVKTKGNIINISSVAASLTPKIEGVTPYCVSKAALNHFTRCAAVELAGEGVRVNTVSPGPVITDILDNAGMTNVKIENFADTMPLKRVSQSVEIADMILFLASDKAVGVTGSEFIVDNGCMFQ
ncbi:3-oxoacyl-[acyl-carrier-protein] reductase FabG-like [Pieris brassicae]|uniref:3-oxoacyl-[acyl-carrier-protein] reductase FabG-like n=1 Tax=Pieris brassicae TaxID=7116 RepID=UPI001E65F9F8|nr:3-oxoacyl-[acyl-carrier-protein] reductase FabG-like [Pieris brassicae]